MSDEGGRTVKSSFTVKPAEEVPGAVLSPEARRRLDEELREWDECERRSRAGAHRCWVGR